MLQLPFGAVKSHFAVPRTQPYLRRTALEIKGSLLVHLVGRVRRRQHFHANLGCPQPTSLARAASDRRLGSPDDVGDLRAVFGLDRELDDGLAIAQQISQDSRYLAL